MDPLARAALHQLPYHDGDGYSFGGDWILTVGERAIHLGAGNESKAVGARIVNLWNEAAGHAAKEP